MTRLPRQTRSDVVRALGRAGFDVVRVNTFSSIPTGFQCTPRLVLAGYRIAELVNGVFSA